MTADEPTPGRPPESGDKTQVDEEQAGGRGGEGNRNAETTPRITPAGDPGQTSHPAPPDDVGVPPDEELGEEKHQD
jgi:hypothetical protein